MDKLLPCPFCGSAHVLGDGEADDNWFECMDCNARGPRTTYIDAIDIDASEEAWNRRSANATPDTALLALARLGAMVISGYLRQNDTAELCLMAGLTEETPAGHAHRFPGIIDAIAALLAPDGAGEVADGD